MKDLIIDLVFPVLAVSIIASLEVFALQQGVNGHGLLGAFTAIGTVFGAWVTRRFIKNKKGE